MLFLVFFLFPPQNIGRVGEKAKKTEPDTPLRLKSFLTHPPPPGPVGALPPFSGYRCSK